MFDSRYGKQQLFFASSEMIGYLILRLNEDSDTLIKEMSNASKFLVDVPCSKY